MKRWESPRCTTSCVNPSQHLLLTTVGGDDSDDDEDVDSNNDGGSLQSERTDKDEETPEGKPRALSRHPNVTD